MQPAKICIKKASPFLPFALRSLLRTQPLFTLRIPRLLFYLASLARASSRENCFSVLKYKYNVSKEKRGGYETGAV